MSIETPYGTTLVAGSRLSKYPVGMGGLLASSSEDSASSLPSAKLRWSWAMRVVLPLPAIPTTMTHVGDFSSRSGWRIGMLSSGCSGSAIVEETRVINEQNNVSIKRKEDAQYTEAKCYGGRWQRGRNDTKWRKWTVAAWRRTYAYNTYGMEPGIHANIAEC